MYFVCYEIWEYDCLLFGICIVFFCFFGYNGLWIEYINFDIGKWWVWCEVFCWEIWYFLVFCFVLEFLVLYVVVKDGRYEMFFVCNLIICWMDFLVRCCFWWWIDLWWYMISSLVIWCFLGINIGVFFFVGRLVCFRCLLICNIFLLLSIGERFMMGLFFGMVLLLCR